MSEKFHIGNDVTGFENNGEKKPISRVTLYVDDSNVITSGDDTGSELVADCPFATQDMADAILSKLKGHQYRAYTADDANLDPSAELGDGVTASGVYSVLSRIEDDGSGYPSISAPGEAELEDEYPSAGPMTQEFNRQLAQVRSSITKTAENITLRVAENEDAYTKLSLDVGSLSSRVQSAEGDVSTLSQKVNNITLSVSNGDTSSTISLNINGVEVSSKTIEFNGNIVFESDLEAGKTSINGACIDTGTILADYIDLYGWLKVYQELDKYGDVSGTGGYIGYTTGWEAANASGVSLQTTGIGVSANKSCSTGYLVCTSGGARIGYGSNTALGCSSANIFASQAISEGSDRRIKNSFLYDIPETYEAMYRALKPCRYKRNDSRSDRYHTGFVAQEIEEAVKAGGLESTDLAAYCIDDTEDKMYSVRYTELIALNTAFVQKLMTRVDELEERLKKLEGGV